MNFTNFHKCHLFVHTFPFDSSNEKYSDVELSCLYLQDFINGILHVSDSNTISFFEELGLDVSAGLLLRTNSCTNYYLPGRILTYSDIQSSVVQNPVSVFIDAIQNIICDIDTQVLEYEKLFSLYKNSYEENEEEYKKLKYSCIVSYVLESCKQMGLLCSLFHKEIDKINNFKSNKCSIDRDVYNGIRRAYYCILKCFYALSLVVKYCKDEVDHLKSIEKCSCNFDLFWIDTTYLFNYVLSTEICEFTFEQLLSMVCKCPADIYLMTSLFQYECTLIKSSKDLGIYKLHRNWIFNNRIKSYITTSPVSYTKFLKIFPEDFVFKCCILNNDLN